VEGVVVRRAVGRGDPGQLLGALARPVRPLRRPAPLLPDGGVPHEGAQQRQPPGPRDGLGKQRHPLRPHPRRHPARPVPGASGPAGRCPAGVRGRRGQE
jgi:hypothetical protein